MRWAYRKLKAAVRWLRACGENRMDTAWLKAQRVQEQRRGWDGPRWRTPAERARMAREDRRKGMSVVPLRRAR